ncbi:UDP-N-acetylgalactosamine-undecaprenyl-phosphate N-acetylgalactosaminephosphotransferase [Clostridiales bacterium CHKCI006]|nr:UDP-N-acetylgalactosamine-undecaprenyl-phosphate N-acetylgalactosaminephosphotransferase [Clostridiales bacterium CHKCI006]
MLLRKWEDLPEFMRIEEVRPYYESLNQKKLQLFIKRVFDVVLSLVLLIILLPVFLILAIWIKVDSDGPVFYRQERVTQYGKIFKIFKFRTMVVNADRIGSLVTTQNDVRVTKVGEKIRNYRLDEIPQLLNVLIGDMTFVGTRPEARKFVISYKPEMLATLLLPAGITSEASIRYKDEAKILDKADDIDTVYTELILPEKMKYNLDSLKHFNFFNDLLSMLKTFTSVVNI